MNRKSGQAKKIHQKQLTLNRSTEKGTTYVEIHRQKTRTMSSIEIDRFVPVPEKQCYDCLEIRAPKVRCDSCRLNWIPMWELFKCLQSRPAQAIEQLMKIDSFLKTTY